MALQKIPGLLSAEDIQAKNTEEAIKNFEQDVIWNMSTLQARAVIEKLNFRIESVQPKRVKTSARKTSARKPATKNLARTDGPLVEALKREQAAKKTPWKRSNPLVDALNRK